MRSAKCIITHNGVKSSSYPVAKSKSVYTSRQNTQKTKITILRVVTIVLNMTIVTTDLTSLGQYLFLVQPAQLAMDFFIVIMIPSVLETC